MYFALLWVSEVLWKHFAVSYISKKLRIFVQSSQIDKFINAINLSWLSSNNLVKKTLKIDVHFVW